MIFELRMVWRETRPAYRRFSFLVAAIALGVGALTGLKGFSQALEQAISRSARDLIAADLAVRFNSPPNSNELEVLESLVKRGAQLTQITETLSMVSSSKTTNPVLSNVKAVDPEVYPFYGTLELDPPVSLSKVLTDNAAVVSPDFLVRTGTSLGDTVLIGGDRFRLVAIVRSEPDRLTSGVDLGPRILITQNALRRSGLIQFGSRVSESFLYRLPSRGLSLEEARSILRERIERRVRITDYSNPNPFVSRGLERTANFLSLIGLLALLVGGLATATTIHTYLQQKLDDIAVLKCVGGRSSQILRIYLIQGLVLGGIGSVFGIGLGYLVQLLFPSLLKGLIDLPTHLEVAPGAAIQGLCIGLLTTTLFSLPPLLAIRKVKPARVFLREMPETRHSTLMHLPHDLVPLLSSVLLLLGVGLAASWLAESFRWGFTFLAGLIACVLVLVLAARVLMAGLKRVPRPSSLALKYGLKNLNRPGNHVTSVMAALGIGVAFVLTIYFIQTFLIAQIVKGAPADFPNVFLLGVSDSDKATLSEFLTSRRGVIQTEHLIPTISSRLLRIDGKNADELGLEPHSRRYFQAEFSLTYSENLPPDTVIIEGKWWQPPYQSPMISVGENSAQHLKIRLGSTLDFDISGRVVRGKVVNIRDTEFPRPGSNNQFIFSPGALEGLPTSYIGSLRMSPSQVTKFQSELFTRFPTITSIDVGTMLTRIQDLLDRISDVIRFIAFFAIAAGTIILASSVVSTRYQRIREAVLLKTLGATRSQVALIQATEFLILGSAAGLIGGILAAITAHYLLGNLLGTEFEFRFFPLTIAIAATAALSIATGWLANRGVLNHKPLEVLREN